MRKVLVVAGTALLMALAGTISAPSASAFPAPPNTVDGCNGGLAVVYLVPNGVPVRVDTSACIYGGGYLFEVGDTTSVVAPEVPVDPATPAFVDVTLGAASRYVDLHTPQDIVIYSCDAPTADGLRPAAYEDDPSYWDPIFAAAVDHCDWAVPSTGGAAPPSWFQAYGRHAGEACAAGWAAGWAEWPNDGRGGPVCNRETYWDINSGAWSTR